MTIPVPKIRSDISLRKFGKGMNDYPLIAIRTANLNPKIAFKRSE